MISKSSANKTIFYLYTSSKGKKFFHDPVKNEVYWDVPFNSIIFDGNTNQQISYEQANPGGANYFGQIGQGAHSNLTSESIRRSNSQVRLITRSRSRKGSLFSNKTKISSDLPYYLPPSILSDKDSASFEDFAKANFRKLGKKKSGTRLDLLLYDENPNSMPLLNFSDSKLIKKAAMSFTLIVRYMNNTEEVPLSQITRIAAESPYLVDEIYMQLFRQVRSCKVIDATYRGWDIIMVMCTLFIPSKKVVGVVRSFLSTFSSYSNRVVARAARLSYIRFIAIVDSGKAPRDVSDSYVDSLVNNKLRHIFGASLNEIFYVQNIYLYDTTFVPIFLQSLCDALTARDVFHTEGIFQVTIDSKRLDTLVAEIESGKNVFQSATVLELGSLLKKFISDLLPPLIAIQAVKDVKTKEIVKIADALPKVQKDTLAYIVGFVRAFCKEAKKEVEPYAMIFGSNVLQTKNLPSKSMKESLQLAKVIMQKLIVDWDVSWVYRNDGGGRKQ